MLGTNLKYLRKKKKLSQQDLSDVLEIPRTTLGDYEREKTEPNIAMLIRMAEHFDVKIDTLVTQDISHNDYEVMRNKDLRILAISVDKDNDSNIELVDSKAEAGYLDSYHNPEYIMDLPKISLPNIPKGTYRAFEIQGDSMLPIESGSVIICAYIENIKEIKNNKTYIVISKREGMVYKRVKLDADNQRLVLVSDNNLYLPYKIDYADIDEIWQYYAHVSFSDDPKEIGLKVEAQISDIQKKVSDLHQRLN
ncbi:helix-turn-helix domain-containing protein [Saprospiraceae bacterium]|nr:helix-turn-helix domain-containing protein [Saprospiraceae bacterium]